MPEGLLTGLMALGGVLLGALLTYFISIQKRKWDKEDKLLEYKAEILDIRRLEIEEYIKEYATMFSRSRNIIKELLKTDDVKQLKIDSDELINDVKIWDQKIFILRRGLKSIDDIELNTLIDEIDKITEELGIFIINNIKLEEPKLKYAKDINILKEDLKDLSDNFINLCNKCYIRIDQIKLENYKT